MRLAREIIILLLLFSWNMLAQPQDISILRYQDNNQALASDTNDIPFHRKIKMIPLAKDNSDSYLSFGGEIRGQVRGSDKINFGDVKAGAADHELFFVQRYMLHMDVQANKHFRVFAQITSNHIQNKKEPAREIERDDLDIMQAFVELRFDPGLPLCLRLGRQDLLVGSERMIGTREGPSIRQSFDGARFSFTSPTFKSDFFIVRPVITEFGIFDDAPNPAELDYGAYSNYMVAKNRFMDIYYLGAHRNNALYANDTANENRHSLGVRYCMNGSPFFLDAEATYQFGKFGDQSIHAWQVSSFLGYQWSSLLLKPQLRFAEFIFSGDQHALDGRINTFRPIAAKPPAGDLLSIGPANAIIISPDAEITLPNHLSFNLRYQAAWRFSTRDGLYTPNVKVMYRDLDSPGEYNRKFYLQGITVEINYLINKHFSFNCTAGYFMPEAYAMNTGQGNDLKALSTKVSYKF
jgi:hypothetical protein